MKILGLTPGNKINASDMIEWLDSKADKNHTHDISEINGLSTSAPAEFFVYTGTGPEYKDTYSCATRDIELPLAPSAVIFLTGVLGSYNQGANTYTCVSQGTTKSISSATYFKLSGNIMSVCDYHYTANSGLSFRTNRNGVTYTCLLIK